MFGEIGSDVVEISCCRRLFFCLK